VDEEFRRLLPAERLQAIVSLIPEEWLTDASSPASASERRQMYAQFLETRIAHSEIFVQEAQYARKAIV
jgi:hypothetical protein